MMNAIKYMDELEKKGFTTDQAKTSVNLWIELMNENLASKTDLLEFRTELKDLVHKQDKELLSIRSEMVSLRHELKGMETRLSVKLGGIMITGITVLAILQKL